MKFLVKYGNESGYVLQKKQKKLHPSGKKAGMELFCV
jgi:hypothetical protein